MGDDGKPAVSQPRSEEIVRTQWDRCVANGLAKTGVGLCVGVVLSVLFFKSTRSLWRAAASPFPLTSLCFAPLDSVSPVAFTTGISVGMSYAQCQTDFAHAARRFKQS